LKPSLEFAVNVRFLTVVSVVNPLGSLVFLDLKFEVFNTTPKFLFLGLTETLVVYGFLPIIGSY
jgi:energy-converting hydrogenase Eha subunit G